MNRRYSPLGVLVSDHTALRKLEGEAFIERYLASYQGGLATINAYFAEMEAEFLREREAADTDPNAIYSPDYFDEVLLNIRRQYAARHLMIRARGVFHPFIMQRSLLPMPLPELPTWPLTALEKRLEDRLREIEHVA